MGCCSSSYHTGISAYSAALWIFCKEMCIRDRALAHAVYIVFSHILSRVNGAIFLPMQRSCCAPFLTPQP